MHLEDEQYELLAKFVEAHRSTPVESRGVFIASQTHDQPQATFLHSRARDLNFQGSMSDAEILADAGLLLKSYNSSGGELFSVLPRGIDVYQKKKGASPPLDTVPADLYKFISSTEFKAIHGAAFTKWERAAELLWAADSVQNLTTIGHLCREVLQEFAASLAQQHRVDISAIEPAKTVARLKKIVEARQAGGAKKEFLSALIAYWGAVSDLVQRQEHGALKEGEPLTWEDARCVVFQTCVVMFEISRGIR
jgi:hypothetical protein